MKNRKVFKKQNQQDLFEENYFILNTLECERTEINKEIRATTKAIDRNQAKLAVLSGRRDNLSKSIKEEKKLIAKKEKKK